MLLPSRVFRVDDIHISHRVDSISSIVYALIVVATFLSLTDLKVYTLPITLDYHGSLQNLWKRGGSLELFDVFCELPQLVHRLGLKKWKVSYLLYSA